MSRDIKYIGMDLHKEAVVIAVLNGSGKLVMESIVETKASSILQFIHGLRGELQVTWEEGTWASWLYDLKPTVGLRSFATNGVGTACIKPLNEDQRLRFVSLSYSVALRALEPKSSPRRRGAWMQGTIEVQ
jgi:hypothetical protein